MEFFGIKFAGVNAENGNKLLMTIGLIFILLALSWVVSQVIRMLTKPSEPQRWIFWVRQIQRLVIFFIASLGLTSIWLDEPGSLSTAMGLATAGLAFALQKVITSFAAYFTILFANNYTVGERIAMGGVRGDVIAIGFLQTTIMEMGSPPSIDGGGDWINSRQYTGRVVSVANGKIFDEPIYNYTRDFEFVWESIALPITYEDNRAKAEEILLKAAKDHTQDISKISQSTLQQMQERYFVPTTDMDPAVYFRITDNWLELTLRFIVTERGIRDVKDRMSRQIVADIEAAGIGVASATYDVVGMPPLRIDSEQGKSGHDS